MKSRHAWFLGFTAVFAVLAAGVFWGTWSLDVVPVMPDATTTYPADHISRTLRGILESGRFIPLDLIGLTGSPYLWQELRFVLALYLAALGLVYLCRGRGLSRPASYGAGLLLGFCGYWATLFSAGHYGWFQWMAHGMFAFGLADRAVTRGKLRHWLLLGAVVAWASFNQQDLWLLFTVFTTIYFVWCCVRERKFPWKGALVALVTFLLVGLPNIVDQFQGGVIKGREEQIAKGDNITNKNASDAEKRWEFVTNWSLPTEDTLEFFSSRVHGDTSCPFVLSINGWKGVRPYDGALGRPLNAPRGNYRQHSVYVGWVTCLLALCGVVSIFFSAAGRRADRVFFTVAALVFYSLSLGRYFEAAYRVVFALPLGDLIRCPVKWHHLTELCLAVLAAYGVDFLMACARRLNLQGRLAQIAAYAPLLLVLWGAIDLAMEAHRFCAPVSVREARRTNSSQQMTIMKRADFQNPQVAAMVKSGRIVSIANYMGSPDYYVVGILEKFGPREKGQITGKKAALGAVSVLMTLLVAIYSIFVVARPRNMV